jgi:hypothetical protein
VQVAADGCKNDFSIVFGRADVLFKGNFATHFWVGNMETTMFWLELCRLGFVD